MSANSLPVVIIGAGTGGLALAHGLRAAGVPVQVYERDRHRTGGLQGFRVGISPNGVRALRDCLPADLFEIFVATTAKEYEWYSTCTEQLKPLFTISRAEMTGDTSDVARDYSVSRMTMRQVLLTGLEDVVHFDKQFTEFTEHEGRGVTAHFEDGTSVTGRLLVGADGANSRVRKQYLPRARQSETGLIAIGGKQAITPANTGLLTGVNREGMSMIFDKRNNFGILHVMEFPWRGEQIEHGIGGSEAALLEQWPGLLFDNTSDYFSWGVSLSRSALPQDVLRFDGLRLRELVLREVVYDWHPNLRALIRDSDPSATFALSVRTSDPLERWTPGRVTVLGDAAHTMTPGRGAGANTALRDAQVLRDELVAAWDEAVLDPAVGRYEEAMRGYSAPAVRDSLQGMHDSGLTHRPVRRALARVGMRTGMRIADRVPPVKRRAVRALQRTRDSEREDATAPA